MAATGHLTVAAILVAAGEGRRLGADIPKAFCTVAGRTLLEHAAERFIANVGVRDVIVAVAPDRLPSAAALVPEALVVAGGATRRESVSRALEALDVDVDAVLVHDVARPFVPAEVIARVIAALESGAEAVIPAMPVIDTVKRVADGFVTETLDRSSLQAVQTPQGFLRAVLVRAHRAATDEVTDDAALVEIIGGRVRVVEGAAESFKITTAWDLVVAGAAANR